MDIESVRKFCKSLPAVTEDVKWGNDLCFLIAGKMFCVAGLSGKLAISFKVKEDEFYELTSNPGIIPAPYVARYKWVLVHDMNRLSKKEFEHYIRQSYELIKSKISVKKLKNICKEER